MLPFRVRIPASNYMNGLNKPTGRSMNNIKGDCGFVKRNCRKKSSIYQNEWPSGRKYWNKIFFCFILIAAASTIINRAETLGQKNQEHFMAGRELTSSIGKIITEVSGLIPEYMNNQADKSISNGNVAVCIIDGEGNLYGKLFGSDKIRTRQAFRVAYTKASQVWITGMRTGEFEKKVFNGEINEYQYGLQKPDFIGWEGGQPITLKEGTTLSVGFSGFRGTSDLEIVQKAISKLGL